MRKIPFQGQVQSRFHDNSAPYAEMLLRTLRHGDQCTATGFIESSHHRVVAEV
ncbi:hypothetical protein SJ05684_c09110 [Sinorhizobium sojae CCBAU 05684]|uniref:Uncharacterized protein n=1 Tax=Sinorhizobium sojae CCBAU 05684 TaxID=716928 RepID=A0A249P8W6_9HYPH|nr:hypothetical protein SJ05684_c09110 [Sinorhizobium sojae CCBAU 05684]